MSTLKKISSGLAYTAVKRAEIMEFNVSSVQVIFYFTLICHIIISLVLPPGVLALGAAEESGRRLVRASCLNHLEERLVVAAFLAFLLYLGHVGIVVLKYHHVLLLGMGDDPGIHPLLLYGSAGPAPHLVALGVDFTSGGR